MSEMKKRKKTKKKKTKKINRKNSLRGGKNGRRRREMVTLLLDTVCGSLRVESGYDRCLFVYKRCDFLSCMKRKKIKKKSMAPAMKRSVSAF